MYVNVKVKNVYNKIKLSILHLKENFKHKYPPISKTMWTD